MKTIDQINDLNNKKILVRVDFNLPIIDGKIMELYRLKSHLKTIEYLKNSGGIIVLLSHLSSKNMVKGGFREINNQIRKFLKINLKFIGDIKDIGKKIKDANPGNVFLLENIRRWPEEEKNDKEFAKELAKSFDIYVNDAFSVSHRKHSSVVAITEFLPSFSGFLLQREVENLNKVLKFPQNGKTVILGGAKISTKIKVIKNFINKAEYILIGGAIANAIFKFKGIKIGKSFSENSGVESNLKEFNLEDQKIILPIDILIISKKKSLPNIVKVGDLEEEEKIVDIGPETIKKFCKIIKESKMIIFNGPLGLVEIERFSFGTRIILDSIIRSGAFSVVGGGDTLSLIEKLNLFEKFNYISTGGGAMLEFLAERKLPGLEALGYY